MCTFKLNLPKPLLDEQLSAGDGYITINISPIDKTDEFTIYLLYHTNTSLGIGRTLVKVSHVRAQTPLTFTWDYGSTSWEQSQLWAFTHCARCTLFPKLHCNCRGVQTPKPSRAKPLFFIQYTVTYTNLYNEHLNIYCNSKPHGSSKREPTSFFPSVYLLSLQR